MYVKKELILSGGEEVGGHEVLNAFSLCWMFSSGLTITRSGYKPEASFSLDQDLLQSWEHGENKLRRHGVLSGLGQFTIPSCLSLLSFESQQSAFL